MPKNDSLGSLFGKAKKWAQQELKNTVSLSGDPSQSKRADQENADLAREVRADAEQLRDDTIITALTPQSIKDYQAMNEANRKEQATKSAAEARAARQARAGASSVELTGYITGRIDGLAVETNRSENERDLFVSVECVDHAVLAGGTVSGFNFTIPDFHGDGTYPLVDRDDFEALQYELYLVDADDGWGFNPSIGPGLITVADGTADVQMVLGSVGTETIQLHGTIVL